MAKPEKAEKAEKAPKVEKPARIQQNGVSRPNGGTNTGRVWEIADDLSKATGKPASRKDVLEKAVSENINVSTAATQYGQWRKFNGLGKEESTKKVVEVKKAGVTKKAEAEAEADVEGDDGEEEFEENEFGSEEDLPE